MKKSGGYQVWIETGYSLFSREGRSGIQVERLARIIGLNKSGFYHFFGDRETYFEHLIKHHVKIGHQFVGEIEMASSFIPKYITQMTDYSEFILVNIQLAREKNENLSTDTHTVLINDIAKALMPVWSEFLGLPNHPHVARQLFFLFNDMLYSRLAFENFDYEFLFNTSLEAKAIVENLHFKREFVLGERFVKQA